MVPTHGTARHLGAFCCRRWSQGPGPQNAAPRHRTTPRQRNRNVVLALPSRPVPRSHASIGANVSGLRASRAPPGSAAARAVGRASRQAGGGHNIQLMEASAAGRCHYIKTFLDTDEAFLTGAYALSTNKSMYEKEPGYIQWTKTLQLQTGALRPLVDDTVSLRGRDELHRSSR